MASFLTKRTSSPPKVSPEQDLEAADEVPSLARPHQHQLRAPSMVRTTSCSGTFVNALPEEPMRPKEFTCRLPRAGTIVLALIGVLLLAAFTASAWSQQKRAIAIEGELHELRASLASLVKTVREQGEVHSQSASLLHAQGKLQSHQGKLNAETFKEAQDQLAAQVPSAEQIASRLAPTLTEVSERLRRLEGRIEAAAAAPSAVGGAAPSPTTVAALPMSARGDGSVKVTFRFRGAGGSAALFWLGRERADHSYHETKYTEIPHGMQVIETTRPGECWRARDARSGAPILETYCATIEQAQEVQFGGEPEKNNGTTPALPAKAPKLLDRAW